MSSEWMNWIYILFIFCCLYPFIHTLYIRHKIKKLANTHWK